ncbi:flavin reductase family protein [Providencia manganoxydans]|uniref:flavin reductase family protein n=1 Tax=Providencia manganoxydans TaxID=2923283 RepID=UPI0029C0F7DE|nr:flavin reductase family protein [Providencia manganoxydans]MDX4945704.1 flavin reductase family protein [Providencia manganoxydans]
MLTADDFKLGMRKLALPVAVISVESDEQRNGLTASSFCSVSVDPPRFLICVGKTASAHPQISIGEGIAVNVLSETQHEQAMQFASKTHKGEQRFSLGEWNTLHTGAPILDDTTISFDCIVDNIIDDVTHSIITATVVAQKHTDNMCLLYRDGKPMLSL